MRKIIAVVVALTMIMALSISVFADNSGTYEASATEDNMWWHETKFFELFDLSELEGATTLTIESSVEFTVGYNGENEQWIQPDTGTTAIVIDLTTAVINDAAKVCVRPGNTSPFTITWTIAGGASAPAEDNAPAADNTPAEDTTPAPSTSENTAPKTGLALAVVPAVMALAAAAVTKKR